ncbi:hypothetical protein EYW49_22080 [Siculibacillus lacustris]|uniref:PEP-CTERM sorting domain-containing protein n=1 Tax=Siculibacillus lacustris TaxID=1549641 RepID=A0A4Q9VEK0_9HYPH|nr:hypothetical protein [Siculibacillus lacustris]TBW32428.1 hypothetical protein EYW49_22080 [Siculibacillus lacustris]
MRSVATTAVISGLVVALSAGASSASNLVANGDFTSSLSSGWNATNQVNISTDTDYIAHAGASGSSGVGSYLAFGAGDLAGGSIWQTLSTVKGLTYKLSFDYAGFGSTNDQTLSYAIGAVSSSVSVYGS